MSVSVVVQRFRECKLLLLETDYVTVGGGDNSCGILAYISLAASATPAQVEQAAHTLLHLPILTTGLWGDGASSTASLLSLAADAASSCSLVLVPQANLISKVKQGGKSIQYHGQIGKEEGEKLYDYFCECVQGKLLEEQCASRSVEIPAWYRTRRAALLCAQEQDGKASPSTPPDRLLRDETKYGAWDDRGMPTQDAGGQELTKSHTKKLHKVYEAQRKRHDKWKEQRGGGDEATAVTPPVVPPPAHWDESLDPSFCHVVAGSFGKRQGLELRSDMGPFVHSFQV